MEESIAHIGVALKAARQKKGLSQRALSTKTGVPQSHISKIENGTIDLQTSSLIQISRALDLEPMLIPRPYINVVKTIIQGTNRSSHKQIPAYRLDDEMENDDE